MAPPHMLQAVQKFVANVVCLTMANMMRIPVNPPGIVAMDDYEFTVDLNKMERFVPYLVKFVDSRYVIWKNENDALVMVDVDFHGG